MSELDKVLLDYGLLDDLLVAFRRLLPLSLAFAYLNLFRL